MIRDEHKSLLSLPVSEKAELIDELQASIGAAELAAIDKAWAAEAERRIDAYNSGTIGSTPAFEALAEIRRQLST